LEHLATKGQNYAIVLNEGNEMIGNISLMEINNKNRTATVGLFIGEETRRGKGYGTQAIKLLLQYGYETLNINNFMLHVHGDNERAIACYKKVGFKEIGRRRQAVYKNGAYIDDVFMDIVASDLK